MIPLLEGTASLSDLLMVISSICVIVFILSENKRVRAITGLIWLATLLPIPSHLPYRFAGIVIFGGITLFARHIVRKIRKTP